jgi:molybdate transport system regulatory protein
MQIKLKISILNDAGSFLMGPGPLRLLESIRKHKSINKAAKSMRLSYVKALNMLNGMEDGFGVPMVIRRRGGNDRGGTQLTPYAEMYIEQYHMLEKKINTLAAGEFDCFQQNLREKMHDNE